MATTLTIQQLRATIGWNFTDGHDYGNSSNANSFVYNSTLTAGTGAGKANKIYIVQDTTGLAGSALVNVDLTACTDPYYNTISIGKVKSLFIANDCTTAVADLIVGAATSNPWAGTTMLMNSTTSTLRVPASSFLYAARTDAAGWPTSATQKTLCLTNAHTSTSLPYRLVVIGE